MVLVITFVALTEHGFYESMSEGSMPREATIEKDNSIIPLLPLKITH